jgi:hypothetical protein
VIVVGCLIALDVRIHRFNHELEDFTAVAAKAQPGADARSFMTKGDCGSEVWGYRAMATAPAWFTAEHGGILLEDYAARFNMPVQRKAVPFPYRYQYIFTCASAGKVKDRFPEAVLLAKSGPWSLYEEHLLHVGPFTIHRFAQRFDDLIIDQSEDDRPLTIAGVPHSEGLGTDSDSWIELRAPEGKTTLSGACGIDDSARADARARCVVRQRDGTVLWHAIVAKGEPAAPFSVSFPADGALMLEIFAVGTKNQTHGDWVDLK